jgi:hypothetical protein
MAHVHNPPTQDPEHRAVYAMESLVFVRIFVEILSLGAVTGYG